MEETQNTTPKLPAWDDLPDLDIYMDQMLALVEKYLGDYPGLDEKGLTSSMVNNYVKQGFIPAPTNKKYSKTQLADLIIISILKPVIPINAIGVLLRAEQENGADARELYERFCEYAEETRAETTAAQRELGLKSTRISTQILCAALRAQAEQTEAMKLLSLLTPPEPPKNEKSSKKHEKKSKHGEE